MREDEGAPIPHYEHNNYKLATSSAAFNFVDNLICDEPSRGKLRISESKPHCIHSIGAVPKKDGESWRPITDCSRPLGESINVHMSTTFKELCIASVDQVVNTLELGCWMSSVDISAAYRSIMVNPDTGHFKD